MGNISDMTREKEILHHASLNGPLFDQDPKKVMWIIRELTIGTPEEAWIKQAKFGRVAIKKLWGRYDKKSEVERQKTGKGGAQDIALLP